MANQKTRKKTSNTRRKTPKDDGLQPFQDEITILVTLVVCILLLLSNFHMCGRFGEFISTCFFGLFGCMNYLLPFGIFIGIAFYLSNKGNRKAKRKLISVLCLMLDLMALLQMATGVNANGMTLSDYYAESAESKLGGGVIGGGISHALISLFGGIGTVVILLGIAALLFMFITEKLIFSHLGKQSYEKMQNMKEQQRLRREEYEKEHAKQQREEVKRKAKTFTIPKEEPVKKENKQVSNEEKPLKNTVAKESKESRFKKRGRKSQEEVPVGMEEIKPADAFDNLVIERESSNRAGNNESVPIYEEELMQKFNPVNAKMDESVLGFEKETSPKKAVLKKPDTEAVLEHAVIEREIPKSSVQNETPNLQSDNKTSYEESIPSVEKVSAVEKQTENRLDYISPDSSEEEVINYDAVEVEEALVVPGSIQNNASSKTPKTASAAAGGIKGMNASKEARQENKNIKQVVEADAIQSEIEKKPEPKPYEFPPVQLLSPPVHNANSTSDEELKETAYKLHQTLESFGVKVTITNVSCGPTVTRYELHPEQGVKVSKITNLADDIKLNLAAADVRIEAPIPGKAAVGIEVPNKENATVMFRELIETAEFTKHKSNIAFAVGKDIGGKTVVSDIAKMPHLLIAGATGSGKSVCINTLIMSVLYKASPDDVKLIMIDPKVVELSVYNGIPHLLIPVVTEPKKASAALNWAVVEMNERYNKFAEIGVRDLKGYNAKIKKVEYLHDEKFQKMPEIVIIVDELADLMMVAPGEVEESICRLAQLARAAGIHLIIATQRPSVNVITGVIKANIPSRIAFSVSSAVDSRTIIDGAGAEKLLGKGDMLFYPTGFPKPIRVQGAFISDQEVTKVVEFLTRDDAATYDNSIVEKITTASKSGAGGAPANDRDEYFLEAAKFIIEKDKASIGMLQRVFKIGFNRASRIMDQLYDAGVVGEDEGTKPRKVVMSPEQFEQFVDEYV